MSDKTLFEQLGVTTTNDEQRLEEIKTRVEATSPGPWRFWRVAGGFIITTDDFNERVVRGSGGVRLAEDAEFIANAQRDIYWLLALVRQLRGEVEP